MNLERVLVGWTLMTQGSHERFCALDGSERACSSPFFDELGVCPQMAASAKERQWTFG